MIYSLANDIPNTSAVVRILHKLGSVLVRTGVPGWAVLFSSTMFIYIPFIQLSQGSGGQDVSSLQDLIAD
jgi:hypothetical protein